MIQATTQKNDSLRLLRQPAGDRRGDQPEGAVQDQIREKESDDENYILCRQCRYVITSPSERISVQGAHRHTFANPQGIVFEIGCFQHAPGCAYAGPATGDFSWFGGYEWRIAVCGKCLTHLGWQYSSNFLPAFNGLIIDNLIFTKTES